MATAQEIMNYATSQIGVKESPSNSNNVIYNTHYYGRAVSGADYPWCCSYVWDVFRICGASELFCDGQKTAYCPTVEGYYKKRGKFYKTGQYGDLALFDFTGKAGEAVHIGFVEKNNGDGTYTTIEGNTSLTSDDNGGAVMRRIRSKSQIRGFARPDYEPFKVQFTEEAVNWLGRVTVDDLKVREQPSTQAAILGEHITDDIVTISATTNNGWYRVDYPHIGTGYLYAGYVDIIDKELYTSEKISEPEIEIDDSVPDEWAAKIVQLAIDKGILFGNENGNLNLHKQCTRQEMLVFLYRLYKHMK